MMEFQLQDGTILTRVDSSGDIYVGLIKSSYQNQAFSGGAAIVPLIVRGAASQSANLQEWQSSAGATALSVNSAGLLTGTRAFAINQSNSGEAMFVLKAAASQTGDQLAVRDSSANTIAGFSATGRLYSGVSGSGQTYLGGLNLGSVNTVATQLGVIAGAATTVGAVIRGAASASADLQQWQNSAGTVLAYVRSDGVMRSSFFGTTNNYWFAGEQNSGGYTRFVKSTAQTTSPGAGQANMYFRDGTTLGTLKLVVRAGAAGAETTILDNIPQ
jgi:hypothetical protein